MSSKIFLAFILSFNFGLAPAARAAGADSSYYQPAPRPVSARPAASSASTNSNIQTNKPGAQALSPETEARINQLQNDLASKENERQSHVKELEKLTENGVPNNNSQRQKIQAANQKIQASTDEIKTLQQQIYKLDPQKTYYNTDQTFDPSGQGLDKAAETVAQDNNPKSGDSIRTLAEKSAKAHQQGMVFAGVAATGCAALAAANCTLPPNFMCAVYVSGLAASLAVAVNMNKASKEALKTRDAVDDGARTSVTADVSTQPVPGFGDIGVPPEIKQEIPQIISAVKKLQVEGWVFDPKKGTATTPSGKKLPANLTSSADAMRAAGGSESQIKDMQSKMAGIMQAAEQKAKGADATPSMFSDGGSGGGAAPRASAGVDGFATGYGMPAREFMGINRDPAQVAGLKKNLQDTPIGVSADSTWDMINRRYQLHQSKGAFIGP
jgi:hypothetical protein